MPDDRKVIGFHKPATRDCLNSHVVLSRQILRGQHWEVLSEDPLGFSADGPNFYSYVGNNPVAYDDPTGLAKCGYSISTALHTG
jgi:uncharacterized protein RhaS with RHS repeats